MPTVELYVPEDLMEAHLDTDVSLQHTERKSSTPTGRKSWCFWKRWTSKVDFERKEEEKGCAAVKHSEEESERAEERLKELANQKQQKSWTEELQEFSDTDLADEIMEKPVKDKSIRRRFLKWVNGALQNHHEKKMARTYRRELEEGNRVYRTSYMNPVWSRAQWEQRKRRKLIRRDERRQQIKKRLDDYWEERRHLKEELRLKEEERYVKWMAAHGLNVPASSPEEPKRRMTKWEKRFLRMKEFFFHHSN